MGISPGHLSRLENGKRGTTVDLVIALLDKAYPDVATQTDRDEVLRLTLASLAEEEPHPRIKALLNSTQYGSFIKLERSATKLRIYELAWLPGLIQTRRYAEGVFQELRPGLSAAEIKALVDVRIQRQDHLSQPSGAEVQILVDESALRRSTAEPAVMREQLEHLLAWVQEESPWQVRILPKDIGPHVGLYGAFEVMDFAPPSPGVVWIELLATSTYFDKREQVTPYVDAFTSLWEKALWTADAVCLIEKAIKELPK